jgi:hypothetical protein
VPSIVHNFGRRPAAIAAVVASVVLGGGLVASAQHSHQASVHVDISQHLQRPAPSRVHVAVPSTPELRAAAKTTPTPKTCDVHITNTDPSSHTQVSCSSSKSGPSADSSAVTTTSNSVSITNSSTQSGGSNNVNHSSTTVTIH